MADTENTLRELLDKILDDRGHRPSDIEVKAVSTGGANFTSALFRVTVSSPDRDDLKWFAKVSCVGERMRSIMKADRMYRTERIVYNQLVKVYEEIQEERNILEEHKYVFPKVYGISEHFCKETVVMEDLVAAGFEDYDRFKSMDWEYASAAVENLAKLHALSFAFEKYRPEEFREITPELKHAWSKDEKPLSEKRIAYNKIMVENALLGVKEEYKDIVRDCFHHTAREKFLNPIGKPVICHGDYRISNLLYRKVNGKLEAIAVDYQAVHPGCPASDLIYFIFLGSDEEFRRQHYDQLLKHYYSSLQQALKRLDVDPGVYTKDKFYGDIKEVLPYAILVGVTVLPMVTVGPDVAPKAEGDADLDNFLVKPNELYLQRFSGIVNDLVRWGALSNGANSVVQNL